MKEDIIKNILLCELSYSEPQDINYVLRDPKYNSIIDIVKNRKYFFNTDTDVNLYIFKYKNILYIVFRGTSSFKDVLIDMQMCFENIINPTIKVHSGFYKQYFSIYKKIIDYIDFYKYNIDIINVLGHSLGGGIATIASSLIANSYYNKVVNCYVFGCPRVGNKNFKIFFNKVVKNHYNYCFYNDIIGMIPLNYKYLHIANYNKICKNKEIVYIENIKWYKRIFYLLNNTNCINPIKNHKLLSYYEYFLQY